MVGLGFSVYGDCESLVRNRLIKYGQYLVFILGYLCREFVTLGLLSLHRVIKEKQSNVFPGTWINRDKNFT